MAAHPATGAMFSACGYRRVLRSETTSSTIASALQRWEFRWTEAISSRSSAMNQRFKLLADELQLRDGAVLRQRIAEVQDLLGS